MIVVEALNVLSDDHVLDMCAAPGGKSIAILQKLSIHGSLDCNDFSVDRKKRLKKNILKFYFLKKL